MYVRFLDMHFLGHGISVLDQDSQSIILILTFKCIYSMQVHLIFKMVFIHATPRTLRACYLRLLYKLWMQRMKREGEEEEEEEGEEERSGTHGFMSFKFSQS